MKFVKEIRKITKKAEKDIPDRAEIELHLKPLLIEAAENRKRLLVLRKRADPLHWTYYNWGQIYRYLKLEGFLVEEREGVYYINW